MEQLPENNAELSQLEQLTSQGYRLVLLRPGEKRPLYSGWQNRAVSLQEAQSLYVEGSANIGIRCGGSLLVLDVDTDDPEKLSWVEEHGGVTPMKVRTPSGGMHCYFRARKGVAYGNKVRLRGEPLDFRHDGGFVVCPPSSTEKGNYRWLGEIVPVGELPVLRVSALRERKATKRVSVIEPSEEVNAAIRRARAYLSTIVSISGEGGHNACFRAACRCRDFGLTPEQAMEVLLVWNQTNAQPPWSERELEHKVEDAYRVDPRSD